MYTGDVRNLKTRSWCGRILLSAIAIGRSIIAQWILRRMRQRSPVDSRVSLSLSVVRVRTWLTVCACFSRRGNLCLRRRGGGGVYWAWDFIVVQSTNSRRTIRTEYVPRCSCEFFLSASVKTNSRLLWFCIERNYRSSNDDEGILFTFDKRKIFFSRVACFYVCPSDFRVLNIIVTRWTAASIVLRRVTTSSSRKRKS